MAPFPVTVRYRFGEGNESRECIFYGLFHDRSEKAVLSRLKEAHRFAAWVEIVEVQWRDAPAAADDRPAGAGGSPAQAQAVECIC